MEGLDGAVGDDAQTQPLCAHSGLDLGDRVLGEEKIIVLYLCLQGGHSGLVPLKTVCPAVEDWWGFYSSG